MSPKIIVTLVFSTLLLGCSSNKTIEDFGNSEAVAPTSLNPQEKAQHTHTRDYNVLKDLDMRRGAGIEQGARKHFLSVSKDKSKLLNSNVKYDRKHTPHDSLNSNNFIDNGNNGNFLYHNFKIGSIKDYSYYELSRWQRFCNKSKNMDHRDWRFVNDRSHVFPEELVETCQIPSKKQMKKHGFKMK